MILFKTNNIRDDNEFLHWNGIKISVINSNLYSYISFIIYTTKCRIIRDGTMKKKIDITSKPSQKIDIIKNPLFLIINVSFQKNRCT